MGEAAGRCKPCCPLCFPLFLSSTSTVLPCSSEGKLSPSGQSSLFPSDCSPEFQSKALDPIGSSSDGVTFSRLYTTVRKSAFLKRDSDSLNSRSWEAWLWAQSLSIYLVETRQEELGLAYWR